MEISGNKNGRLKVIVVFLVFVISRVTSKSIEPIRENVETTARVIETSQKEFLNLNSDKNEEASEIRPHVVEGQLYNPIMESLLINAIKSSAAMVSQNEAINKYAIMLNNPNKNKVDVHLLPVKSSKDSRSTLKNSSSLDVTSKSFYESNDFKDEFTNSILKKRQENSRKFQEDVDLQSHKKNNEIEDKTGSDLQREITNLNVFTKLTEYQQSDNDAVKSDSDSTNENDNEISNVSESSTHQTHVPIVRIEVEDANQTPKPKSESQLQLQLNNITQKAGVDIELGGKKVKVDSEKTINKKDGRGKTKFFDSLDNDDESKAIEEETENYPDLTLFRKAVKNYTHRFESHKIPEYVPRYDELTTVSEIDTTEITESTFFDSATESTKSVVAKIGGFLMDEKAGLRPSQFNLKTIRIEPHEQTNGKINNTIEQNSTNLPKRLVKVLKNRVKASSFDDETTTDITTQTVEYFTTDTISYTDSTINEFDKNNKVPDGPTKGSKSQKSFTSTPITYIIKNTQSVRNQKDDSKRLLSATDQKLNISNIVKTDNRGTHSKENEIYTSNINKETSTRSSSSRINVNQNINVYSTTQSSLDNARLRVNLNKFDVKSNIENDQQSENVKNGVKTRGSVKYTPSKFETISPFHSDTQIKNLYNEQGVYVNEQGQPNPELSKHRGDFKYANLTDQPEDSQQLTNDLKNNVNVNRGSKYRTQTETSSINQSDLTRGRGFSNSQTHEGDVNEKNKNANHYRNQQAYDTEKKERRGPEISTIKTFEEGSRFNTFRQESNLINRTSGHLISQSTTPKIIDNNQPFGSSFTVSNYNPEISTIKTINNENDATQFNTFRQGSNLINRPNNYLNSQSSTEFSTPKIVGNNYNNQAFGSIYDAENKEKIVSEISTIKNVNDEDVSSGFKQGLNLINRPSIYLNTQSSTPKIVGNNYNNQAFGSSYNAENKEKIVPEISTIKNVNDEDVGSRFNTFKQGSNLINRQNIYLNTQSSTPKIVGNNYNNQAFGSSYDAEKKGRIIPEISTIKTVNNEDVGSQFNAFKQGSNLINRPSIYLNSQSSTEFSTPKIVGNNQLFGSSSTVSGINGFDTSTYSTTSFNSVNVESGFVPSFFGNNQQKPTLSSTKNIFDITTNNPGSFNRHNGLKLESTSYYGGTNQGVNTGLVSNISPSVNNIPDQNQGIGSLFNGPQTNFGSFSSLYTGSENIQQNNTSHPGSSTNSFKLVNNLPTINSQSVFSSALGQQKFESSSSIDSDVSKSNFKNASSLTGSNLNQSTYTSNKNSGDFGSFSSTHKNIQSTTQNTTGKLTFAKDDSKTQTRSHYNPGESGFGVNQPGKSSFGEGDQYESSTEYVIGNKNVNIAKNNVSDQNNRGFTGKERGEYDLYNAYNTHGQGVQNVFNKTDNTNRQITSLINGKQDQNDGTQGQKSIAIKENAKSHDANHSNSSINDGDLISKVTNILNIYPSINNTRDFKIASNSTTYVSNMANLKPSSVTSSHYNRNTSYSTIPHRENGLNQHSNKTSNDLIHDESSNDKLASNFAGKIRNDYQITSFDKANLERGSKKYAPTKFETISPYITDSHLKNFYDKSNGGREDVKPSVIQYDDGQLKVYNGDSSSSTGSKVSSKTQYRGNVKFKWDPRSINWDYDYDNNDDFPKRFSYNFNTSTGISASQQGVLKEIDKRRVFVIKGSYQYTAPDGSPVLVNYTADEFGFHPRVVTPLPAYDGETIRTKLDDDIEEYN